MFRGTSETADESVIRRGGAAPRKSAKGLPAHVFIERREQEVSQWIS
jgi:hypothetical protein